MLHETGRDALAILLFTLTVTPIRRLFRLNRIQRVRRMLGVWSFAYALAHLAIYLTFDQLCYSIDTCEFPTIWEDLTERPFIFVGMLAFSILLLLAVTSTTGWMRRLGRELAAAASARLRRGLGRDRPLHLGSEGGHQRAAQVGVFLVVLLGVACLSSPSGSDRARLGSSRKSLTCSAVEGRQPAGHSPVPPCPLARSDWPVEHNSVAGSDGGLSSASPKLN